MAAEIDFDDKFSRMAFLGRESMKKFAVTSVLVTGLNGLGAEICKNIILANVRRVTLHDPRPTEFADLGAQFYLTEANIGENRAAACQAKMQELNPDVRVDAHIGELTDAVLSEYQVIVAVNQAHDVNARLDAYCRANGLKFIGTGVWGLFGSVFVDCGEGFIVHDTNGENPKVSIIDKIVKGNPGVVSCIFEEEGRHDLSTGDMVTFTEVKGMTELNDGVPRRVTVINPYSFSIGDTSSYGDYAGGGISQEFKEPKTLNFKSLADALKEPGEFLISDFAKFDRPGVLHVLFQALARFEAKNGTLPRTANEEDAAALIALANEVNDTAATKVDLNDELTKKLSFGARSVLNPMAATFGGLVGQEVLKVCTGKYMPVFQWFHFDAIEALPAGWPLAAAEYETTGSRYDNQIMVFGKTFQEKVLGLSYFLVGAGALGCEYLKNFALMGVGAGSGCVHVTDDDIIERSNLSRQFLFRNHNVGQSKSQAAAAAVKNINPAFRVRDLQERVSPSTESVFNDAFWASLTGVCNALDNVNARLYVDSRCVFFGKHLLESGTLGTKCNSLVVLPHKSEHYGASRDPPEKEAPQCTIHSFPHNIDHCLVWARSEFVGNFETSPTEANKYAANPGGYVSTMKAAGASDGDVLSNLRGHKVFGGGLLDCVGANVAKSFEDCVAWARRKFAVYCYDAIVQLTHNFPADAVNKKTGKAFWSAPKRFPTALEFDVNDPMHLNFIVAAAILRARTYGIPPPANVAATVAEMVAKVHVERFVPKSGVDIDADAEDAASKDDNSGSELSALTFPDPASLAGFRMNPDKFEKDDDKNSHIAFIMALANLRARAYGIDEVDHLQAKLKAGRIIPAIATTTAMITGFIGMELYKIVNEKPVEDMRNVYANIALPLFAISEPMPPPSIRSRKEIRRPNPADQSYTEEEEIVAFPNPHTVWDFFEVPGTATIDDIDTQFKAKFGVDLTQVGFGKDTLFSAFIPSLASRRSQQVTAILAAKGIPIPEGSHRLGLECNFETEDGKSAELPRIVLNLNLTA